MIGQAEVIVRAEIYDRLRFTGILDRRPNIGASEHAWLVKLRRGGGAVEPFGEARRWREEITALADDEIAEAELGVELAVRLRT